MDLAQADVAETARQQGITNENAASVATLNKFKSSVQRGRFSSYWFQFLLQQYKADELFEMSFVKGYLLFHFAIIAISVSDWNGLEDKLLSMNTTSAIKIALKVVIATLTVFTYTLYALGLTIKSEISSKPRFLIYLCCLLKYLNWYVVLPACCMLYSGELFGIDKTVSVASTATSWLVVIFSGGLSVATIYMRSELPSNGKFNTPNRYIEVAIYTVMLLLVCVTKNVPIASKSSVFDYVSILINFSCVVYAWYSQVFWWMSINVWYTLGHLFISTGRLSVKIVNLSIADPSIFQYIIFLSVFEVVVLRVGYNLCLHRLKMRMQECHTATHQDNFILFFTYDISKQAEESNLAGQLPRDLQFEMSQIGRLSLYSKRRRQLLLNADVSSHTKNVASRALGISNVAKLLTSFNLEAKDPLWAFYVKFSELVPSNQEEMFMYLLLQLVFLGKNLMGISTSLAQYRKGFGKDANNSFQLFLIESMFQGRLEHLSVEDNTEHFSRTTLGEVFSEISKDLGIIQEHQAMITAMNLFNALRNNTKSSAGKDESSTIKLDLSRVLVSKQQFLFIISRINKLINIKTDVYSILFEKNIQKSHFLFAKNETAYSHAKELDKEFTQLIASDLVGNYVLACAVSYFLKVRYDIKRAEAIFKMYKNRLSKFQAMTLIPLRDVTEANFQYNSVVMRLNISHQSTLGMITDISPNYKEHIGEPKDNEPTKINVNSLFPGKMSPDHIIMMRNTEDQPIFNVQQDFQINGFDGYLKPVRYILKLDPTITSGLHSIALLRFKLANNKCMLLANEQLELMSAEIDFWKMMRAFKVTSHIDDIYTLSESLSVHMTWIKFLRTVEITKTDEHGNNYIVGSVATNSDQLLINLNSSSNVSSEDAKLAAKDVAYNQLKLRVLECFSSFDATGIFHRLSDELDLPPETSGLPILASVENFKFAKEVYYRVWITFDNNHMKDRSIFFDADGEEEEFDNKSDKEGSKPEAEEGSKAESKRGKDEYTASEDTIKKSRADSFKPLNMLGQDNEFYSHAATYEKILHKAKERSPIMALLSEAATRKYSEEIQECIGWLQEFYRCLGEDGKMDKVFSYKTSMSKRTASKKTQSIEALKTRSVTDAGASQIFNQGAPKNSKNTHAKNPSNFAKASKEVSLKPERVNNTEDLSYTGDLSNALDKSNPKSAINVAKQATVPQGKQDPESTARQLARDTQRSHTGSSVNTRLIPGSQFDAYTTGSSIGFKPANDNKVVKVDMRSPTQKQKESSAIQLKTSMKKETESRFNFSGNITTRKINSNQNSLAKKQSEGLTGSQSKSRSKKKKLYAKYTVDKNKMSPRDEYAPNEQSFDDAKSQKTSVFSNLARNLFKFRNNRGGSNATTSNFDNKEDLDPEEITKMAGDNAMISHNPANINLISKYMTDYKQVRRTEQNPDDKGASISTRSSTSRGSHFLKMVNTIMDTKKGGQSVYVFTLVSVVFSIYFGIVLQYVFASLKSYNTSNLNNFILLSNFIFLDRKLIESCETQDFLYEHTAAAWNKTEYGMIRTQYQDTLPSSINSTDYLFTRMEECVDDISRAVKSITDQTVNLIDKKDAQDVVAATYRKQELDYSDRFNPNVSFYQPWKMPYISTLVYYIDTFRQNKDTLIEVNKLAWKTDHQYQLDSVMQERWMKAIRSKINLDSTVFDKVLQVMESNFSDMVDRVIVSAVDRHFKEVYILLYLSVAVTACLVCYIIWAAYKINVIQKDYLMNYNMLRPWELFIMVEDLSKIRSMFTVFAYNEIEMLTQYLDFNLFASLAAFSGRVTRLQEHFNRDKDKAARTKRFTHDFFFFSSKFLLIFIFLTGALFGIMGISIYVFLNINNNRIGVQMLLFDSHIKMLGVMKSYLTLTLLSIYGHNLKISGTEVAANAFRTKFQDFLVFQTGKRNEFISYFGQQGAKRIDDISFSDICREMLSIPSLKDKLASYTDVCRKINDGSATKGIVGFLQYQKYFLDSEIFYITDKFPEFLTKSKIETPIRALTLQVFSSRFNEMRLGNWICFNVYYYVMSEMASNYVNSVKLDLEYYVSEVMQYISVGIYGLLLLVYIFALKRQNYEIRICYETFKLIDPFFLMNNRYLQFRFKAAYKGVG